MAMDLRSLRYLLGWLILGTRGGVTRAKIIKAICEVPQNANQLSTNLKMDYRTIRHHLEILQKNKLLISGGEGYGKTYFISAALEDNYSLFENISKRIWEKEKRKKNK